MQIVFDDEIEHNSSLNLKKHWVFVASIMQTQNNFFYPILSFLVEHWVAMLEFNKHIFASD